MNVKPTSPSIALAHRDDGTRSVLESILGDTLGHHVLVSTSRGADLVETAREHDVDLFVSSMRLEDGDAIQHLIAATQEDPRPSIIVTTRDDLASVEHALDDHVWSYLVEPVTADDLRPSIHLVLKRFEEFEALREEIRDLNGALEARRVVEQAKGILMRTKGLDEPAAYARLQKVASAKRKKLVDIAEAIVLADDV